MRRWIVPSQNWCDNLSLFVISETKGTLAVELCVLRLLKKKQLFPEKS